MTQPDNGKPGALPGTTPPGPASPAATSVAPPPRRVAPMSAKKSFQATSGVEKLKAYLREVPKLHDEIRQEIEALRVTSEALRITTERVRRLVNQWEEEQKHGRPEGAGPVPAAAPVAGPAASVAPGQPGEPTAP